MNRKNYLYWLIAILVGDVGLLALGVFGAQVWGLRILSLTMGAIGLMTFVGVLSTSYELDEKARSAEWPMRNAIAASVVIVYLTTVGLVSFYPLIPTASEQSYSLHQMTKAMLESFNTVVLVVVGFYFASSAVSGNREKR